MHVYCIRLGYLRLATSEIPVEFGMSQVTLVLVSVVTKSRDRWTAFPGSTPVPRTAAHWKLGWIYMEILTPPGMIQNDWDPKMVQYFKICCTPFFAPGFDIRVMSPCQASLQSTATPLIDLSFSHIFPWLMMVFPHLPTFFRWMMVFSEKPWSHPSAWGGPPEPPRGSFMEDLEGYRQAQAAEWHQAPNW